MMPRCPLGALLFALYCMLSCVAVGQERSTSGSAQISFTVTGDIMQHDSQMAAAKTSAGQYDYSECFRLVQPWLRRSDFTIGNLELTFGGSPYKGYPCFSAPDTLAYALRDAGFNVLTTANNHSCDRRNRGIVRTIEILQKVGLPRTGTFRDSADRARNTPLLLEKDGKRVAILAYTYGTNGIPFTAPVLVNLIDTVRIAQDIALARQCSDALIVCMHWGEEYKLSPSREQQRLASFLLRQGVHVVVGNHPHVLQPLLLVSDSVGQLRQMCLYSLGNFVSAQRTYPRAGSALVQFTLAFDATGVHIIDAGYTLTYVERLSLEGRMQYRILPLATPDALAQADAPMRRFVRMADSLFGYGWGVLAPFHRQYPLPMPLPPATADSATSVIFPGLTPR